MKNNENVEKSVQSICEEHGGKFEWFCYKFKNMLSGKRIDLKEVGGMLLQVLQEHPEVVQYLMSMLSRIGQDDSVLKSTLDELDDGGQQDRTTAYSGPEEMSCGGGQEKDLKLLIELTTKLKLYCVENMGALLIVLYGLQLDYLQTESSDVKQMILNGHLSKIDTGRINYRNYQYAATKQQKRAYLMKAHDNWQEGISVLKLDVRSSMEKAQEIVSKGLLRRIVNMSELGDSIKRTRVCLSVMENVIPLACTVIGMNHGDAKGFAREYVDFFNDVIGNNISMLEKYCRSEDRDYWERIRKNGSQVMAGSCMNMVSVIDKL